MSDPRVDSLVDEAMRSVSRGVMRGRRARTLDGGGRRRSSIHGPRQRRASRGGVRSRIASSTRCRRATSS